jgi:hypothetical protein
MTSKAIRSNSPFPYDRTVASSGPVSAVIATIITSDLPSASAHYDVFVSVVIPKSHGLLLLVNASRAVTCSPSCFPCHTQPNSCYEKDHDISDPFSRAAYSLAIKNPTEYCLQNQREVMNLDEIPHQQHIVMVKMILIYLLLRQLIVADDK